jgi:hypothetical protein
LNTVRSATASLAAIVTDGDVQVSMAAMTDRTVRAPSFGLQGGDFGRLMST